MEPADLAAGRSLNSVVADAVAAGLPLARAIRLATRSPAERFGLGRWLGGLGPGMLADLIVLSPDRLVSPRLVLVGGRPPPPSPTPTYTARMLDTVRPCPVEPAQMEHPGSGRWRAMELVAPLVTREVETDGAGALVALAIDRLGAPRSFRGLLLGYGLKGGALALSSGWESPSLIAVGDGVADLQIALERVVRLGGGAVVVHAGVVAGEWRAEVAGVHSQAPVADVVEQVASVQGALRALGCELPNPLLTLETLGSPAIPHLRLTAEGYVRLRDGARLGLNWE